MSLLSLPLELFQAVIDETVQTLGLYKVVHLRTVSRLFDVEIQRTIYSLPLFDNEANKVPGKHIPDSMGITMTSRLLELKLRSYNAAKRPLCVALNRTLEFLKDFHHMGHVAPDQDIIQALVREAARSNTVEKLVGWLSPVNNPAAGLTNSMDNAIVVAVAMNNMSLLQELLNKGGDVNIPSAFFGDPLTIAAANASEDMVRMMLDHELVPKAQAERAEPTEPTETIFVRHRLRKFLLKAAARKGHESIVRIVLERKYHTGNSGRGYSKAINNAIEIKNQQIATMLLRRRKPVSRRPAFWERSWYKRICVEIVSHDLIHVMRVILEDKSINQSAYLDAPFRQAMFMGRMEMAKLIATLGRTPALTSYQSALHVAARHGDCDIVDALLEREGCSIDMDDNSDPKKHPLVAAVEKKSANMMRHLLTKKPNMRRHDCGARSLAYAARLGVPEIVDVLLDASQEEETAFDMKNNEIDVVAAMDVARDAHPEIFEKIQQRLPMDKFQMDPEQAAHAAACEASSASAVASSLPCVSYGVSSSAADVTTSA